MVLKRDPVDTVTISGSVYVKDVSSVKIKSFDCTLVACDETFLFFDNSMDH